MSDPWDIGGGAKLWEWCANTSAGIFPYLLRRSCEGGGGDANHPATTYAGRWAGDEMYLVGDYDASKLYEIAQDTYKNIARGLVVEYNIFFEIPNLKLKYKPPTN